MQAASPLELLILQEFSNDGVPAQWASGQSGPRCWGEEDHAVIVADPDRPRLERFSAAFSPDANFLAVSLDRRIKVYDLHSREQKADVLGHERPIEGLHWLRLTNAQSTYGPGVVYLLFIQGQRCYGDSTATLTLATLAVDARGGIIDLIAPLDISKVDNDAMQSVSTHLGPHGDIYEADTLNVRTQLHQTPDRRDLTFREQHSLVICGRFTSFDSQIFSNDGRRVIYIATGHTTQQGTRMYQDGHPPEIVVWDIPSGAEVCRLHGHRDKIEWAGWALGDQSIVTASWDNGFAIWDAETGECRHPIGPTASRNWAGAVSPDGERVLLSGSHELGIFMVSTGVKMVDIDRTHFMPRGMNFIRKVSWSPTGDVIAIGAEGPSVVLLDPATGEGRVVLEYVYEHPAFFAFRTPQWADGGRKLTVRGSDSTLLVWDRERNWKWKFQRRAGTRMDQSEHQVCYLKNLNTIVSVTGDYTVRWWKL
ncbi:WD40-repeat-containing domain protein [Neohortaea acidophila]|uniref:WD40-repeat-containing domain protein n=1 Tax=Neohortaea acidophila TaxID=245834 RepID=A0A6A6PU11_9PEZI|nr:WD40-repeat-containing domain protein [Neohortaea acidophila]KAF2482707.1 WD40-repeat-containing domain protein [Neohortaea acidophila]